MSAAVLIGIIFFLGLIVAIPFFNKNFRIFSILGVVVVISVIGSLFWLSFSNSPFKKLLFTFINPYPEHQVLNSQGPYLPLPPKTTLNYRFSHEGADYRTRLNTEEVLKFYRGLSNEQGNTLTITDPGPEEIKFNIECRGKMYSLSVKAATDIGAYIKVTQY